MTRPRPTTRLRAVLGRSTTRRHAALEERLVWVMGSPRTGSTWLLNLLGWLADATMIDEPLIGIHLATTDTDITGSRSDGPRPTLIETSADRGSYFFSDAHADTWVPGLRRLLLDRLGAEVGDDAGAPVLVKEPNGSRGAPVLLRCLPSSRLLFLVRDGRDVVDSLYDGLAGGWISEHLGMTVDDLGGRERLLGSLSEQWVRSMEAVQRAHDRHGRDRRHVLRYEDLLADPVGRLDAVLRWLDRPCSPERIRHVVEQLDASRVPADQRGEGRFVRAAQPGLWREHLDDAERHLVESIMGPTLRRHGYETS